MRMRLAFAISTSIHPDILVLDEGIGACDAAFLEKVNRHLQEFTDRAALIVLASHPEGLVRQMCRTAVLMESGRVIGAGPKEEVLAQYRGRVANG